jgi:hypothetical protein
MTTRGAIALTLALGAVVVGCDPVHDDAIAALGGEAPGVRQGPLHRPGQPCLLCHDGAFGDPQRFTLAGTIFETQGSTVPSVGATVIVTDATGGTRELPVTNAAGNFYVTPGQYDPAFPLKISVRGPGNETIVMQSLVQGNGTVEPNGSCAGCHFDPQGPSSPGHVCLRLDDGGTPP